MNPRAAGHRHGRGRGGQHGHEPRARILTRELRALDLSVQGWRQHEIATELAVSQAAVSKILRRVEERHLRELAGLVGRQKARQALRLEHIYAQVMHAWEDSKADVTRRRQRQTQPASGGGQHVAELVSENRHGDPRYLAEARGALRDLRTLFGLDAPDRVVVAATPFDALSDAALEQELARQRRLLQPAEMEGVSTTTSELGDSHVPHR
jgi:hypothetical protein